MRSSDTSSALPANLDAPLPLLIDGALSMGSGELQVIDP